jgi:hypothetical protein
MNKTILWIALVTVCMLSSCNDFLDAFPEDKVSEDKFWKTENDVLKFLTNIYSSTYPYNDYNNDEAMVVWDEAMSDNAYMVWTGWCGGQQVLANGTMDVYGQVPSRIWSLRYRNIRKCFQLLENIDKATLPSDKKSQILGETHFLLACNYYSLVLYFGNIPLVKKVMTSEESKELTQASREESVNFILSALDEASKHLEGKEMEHGRATYGACQAYKARVLLFEARWEEALRVTDGLIGKYSLNTNGETPYADLFSGVAEDSQEIIFARPFSPRSGSITTGHTLNQVFLLKAHTGGDPWRAITPTGSLVDSYPMADGRLIHEAGSVYNPRDPYKDRDPRLYQSIIYPTGNIKVINTETNTIEEKLYDPENPETIALQQYNAPEPSPTGYVWSKYVDWSLHAMTQITDCGNDILLIRYAEVLLTRAEALAELKGTDAKDEVCDLLDQLRVRCKGGLIHRENYNTREKIINLVRNERRVELAGEGLRYWDILRWKIAENTASAGYGLKGELYGAYMRLDGIGKNDKTVTVDGVPRRFVETRFFEVPKHYLNPIPQSEIDLNPLLKQNPGW